MKQKIEIKKSNIAMLNATIKSIRRDGSEYKNPQRVIMTLRSEIVRYGKEIRDLKLLEKKCKQVLNK